MPFGFFKKMFKKSATDAAQKYMGDDAAAAVGGAVDEGFTQLNVDENMASVMQSFTGNQQSGLQSLFGAIGELLCSSARIHTSCNTHTVYRYLK